MHLNEIIEKLVLWDNQLREKAVESIEVVKPCNRCYQCCINKLVFLSIPEILRILEMDEAEKIEITKKGVLIKHDAGGKCAFLERGLCSIYDERPFQCLTYPVIFSPTVRQTYVFLGVKGGKMYFNCISETMVCRIEEDAFEEILRERLNFLRINYEVLPIFLHRYFSL